MGIQIIFGNEEARHIKTGCNQDIASHRILSEIMESLETWRHQDGE